MDVNTGHLVTSLDSLPIDIRDRYTPVPFHLRKAARQKLAGNSEATVNLADNSALAGWAAKQRAKSKARRKMAKKSRQRNRT